MKHNQATSTDDSSLSESEAERNATTSTDENSHPESEAGTDMT